MRRLECGVGGVPGVRVTGAGVCRGLGVVRVGHGVAISGVRGGSGGGVEGWGEGSWVEAGAKSS